MVPGPPLMAGLNLLLITFRSMKMQKPHAHRSTTHKERFVHLRPKEGLSPKFSAATIFLREEYPEDETKPAFWFGSISLCWKLDQFNRETGRKNARRHYFEGKIIPIGPTLNLNEAIKIILQTQGVV